MKVVINRCFGGFSISKEAAEWMAERGHEKAKAAINEFNRPLDPSDPMDAISIKYGSARSWYGSDYEREDEMLVAAVEALGDAASGSCAALAIVEVPDGIDYEISEYDGNEHIAENHRTWR